MVFSFLSYHDFNILVILSLKNTKISHVLNLTY